MKRLLLLLIPCILLAGCWDEILYKEVAIVPLAGIDGEPGKVEAYYSFPVISDGAITYSTTEGEGLSLRDARNNAFAHTDEMLDISQLEVLLISENMAKYDLYKHIDVIFRAPRNRLSGRIAIVEGEVSKNFEKADTLPVDAPDFYRGLLETSIKFSIIPDIDLQQASKYLFDEGRDLALPTIRTSEKTGFPEVSGLALFNERVFSGYTLNLKESTILTVLQKKGSKKNAQFTYRWGENGEKYPITVEYIRHKRKWEITNEKVNLTYKYNFAVEEFAHDHLEKKKTVTDIEKFLSKELTKDFQKVINKLQEAKSDAIGLGQNVRAFHPELWKKGNWQETFSKMDIQVKVEAKIARTGIMN
ncbi:Ger(x)C family spore germination protein [Sporosarcina limicola]|uniref:Ger(X)C family germination protein n=1 Tax=Sporosarcina limicola TaxID=34101 RepID=A0A927RCU7_9BACL|nr:Ger(x)C family spore germination protein [Sporosarcina limicola]MBE1554745.1 Ger(x)C family germination protein [Sporosarcina limicola]